MFVYRLVVIGLRTQCLDPSFKVAHKTTTNKQRFTLVWNERCLARSILDFRCIKERRQSWRCHPIYFCRHVSCLCTGCRCRLRRHARDSLDSRSRSYISLVCIHMFYTFSLCTHIHMYHFSEKKRRRARCCNKAEKASR